MRSIDEIRDIPFFKLTAEEKKAIIAAKTAEAEAEVDPRDPRAASVASMAAEVMRKSM